VQGNGTPLSMMAEMLAADMNPHMAGFNQAPALVEAQVIRWFIEIMGHRVGRLHRLPEARDEASRARGRHLPASVEQVAMELDAVDHGVAGQLEVRRPAHDAARGDLRDERVIEERMDALDLGERDGRLLRAGVRDRPVRIADHQWICVWWVFAAEGARMNT
jgi:hypothetical protein